jgi:hypothetical protein
MSYSSNAHCISPQFVGQTPETLQLWLSEAQEAMRQLRSGGKPISLSYNMGAGSKSVAYQPTSVADLEEWIKELARALGLTRRRSAIRPGF